MDRETDRRQGVKEKYKAVPFITFQRIKVIVGSDHFDLKLLLKVFVTFFVVKTAAATFSPIRNVVTQQRVEQSVES